MQAPQRVWKLRTRTLALERVLVMAILNATPDSFSDGGRFLRPGANGADIDLNAVEDVAAQMVRDGADIFDVGGESSRPGAEPVDEAEELRRVVPVVRALKKRFNLPISVDAYRPAVAEAALDAGAEIINDIAAGRYIAREARFADEREVDAPEEMAELVARRRAAVVLMHMRGTPKTMQTNLRPYREGVVRETIDFLRKRRDVFREKGVELEQMAFDPGLGFGKSYDDNFALVRAAEELTALGGATLVGHSRKSFLRETATRIDAARDREPDVSVARLDAMTAQVSVALAERRVDVLRVHNVATTAEALKLARLAGTLAR